MLCSLSFAMPARAISSTPARGLPGRRPVESRWPHPNAGTKDPIFDVIIRRDGSLPGRVVTDCAAGEAAGLRVKLLRGSRTVATTTTDRRGNFTVHNLPEGFYEVVVEGGDLSSRRLYRVWSSSGPPGAAVLMRVPIRGAVLRGQRPSRLPMLSLPQAATVGGIAAGAIAAPVIYHNTLVKHRAPASP